MKQYRQESCSLFLYLLVVCSLVIFLIGFFPFDSNNFHNHAPQNYNRSGNPLIKKLVFLVIDAVRADFVDPTKGRFMPFLQSSIQLNESCFMKFRTEAPTVTMPRIKAITSGAIPSYADVVMNLGSSEFYQDSLLRQAYLQGLRLVFYGDDTWLKMFPTFFHRSGGTHSFFAADFWEVDQNVTKNIEKELEKNDWDIMIAHYLGLDHIGHMEGPQSVHVAPKLLEMDNVIKKIYNSLKNLSGTMFIMTGDHGMKDSGGHGGVTDAEVIVPLVSVGRKCRELPGWPSPRDHIPPQIDITSTIASALDLAIPAKNMGKLVPALLHGMSTVNLLSKMKAIKEQLSEISQNTDVMTEEYKATDAFLQDILNSNVLDSVQLQEIVSNYYIQLSHLSKILSRQRTDFSLTYMVVACILLWIILMVFIFCLLTARPSNAVQFFLAFGTIGHTLSLGSTSFIEEEHQTWYFLWTSLLVLLVRERWRRKVLVKSYVLDIKSCSLLTLCIIHRWLRKLNQTGDKWASLPDWNGYLRTSPYLHFSLFLISLLWVYKLFAEVNHKWHVRSSFLVCLICIASYRLAVQSFKVPMLLSIYPESRGSIEVTAFWAVLIIFCYHSTKVGGPSASWIWALIIGLTLRPHNAILIPAQVFVSRNLYYSFAREENPFWNTLAHLWSGLLFYFYQGNSNSLANIDIAPAFIGSDSYSPVYATALTTIHTYAAPVHALLLSPKDLSSILSSRLLPLTIYCCLVTLQRHHLFVWSVFSPKLLLDTSLNIVFFIVICLHKGGKLILSI